MSNSLEQLLSRISKEEALLQSVEEAVRQGAILPVLMQLGWDTFNIREVIPEFRVGNGRVDYCLRIGERSIFLEVKRATEELEKHEKQLLDYSFIDGVEIAVLTNGLLWWLYLPLAGGNWTQRKFFTIDLKNQEPDSAARHFREFLSRDAVADGTALVRARSIYDSKTKHRLIRRTIPKAWKQLLSGPDQQLLELIADKVEGMSGHRPDLQKIAEYLGTRRIPMPPVSTFDPTPIQETTTKEQPKPRKRGIAIAIDQWVLEANSVRDLYSQVIELLCQHGYMETLEAHVPYSTGPKRYLLATRPFHPAGNKFFAPSEYGGYYMESHKGYDQAVRDLQGLLKLCNLTVERRW